MAIDLVIYLVIHSLIYLVSCLSVPHELQVSDVVTPVPGVELEQPVERHGAVVRMVSLPREIGRREGREHAVQAMVHTVENR